MTTRDSHDERQRRLSHMTLENSPVAVFWVNRDGRFLRVNEAACRLTGYPRDELLEQVRVSQLDARLTDETFRQMFDESDAEQVHVFESACVRKDGSRVPLDVYMNFFEFEGERYSCTFIRDVSERKRAEEQLREAYAELERLKDRLASENVYLQEEIRVEHNFGTIIGGSPAFRRALAHVEQVASTDSTALILGETGTGKELIARAIHDLGPRRDRPLVKVNCAALPHNLIESELFGHEKGAFTGAVARKAGRFELADRGTIFLDEIGDLPQDLQAKLLRVLQEGEFERVGGVRTLSVDVRVIAATNRKLERLVETGEFREDLFYRLNVFPIRVPALRERREDIPALVRYFIEKHGTRIGRTIETVPESALDRLVDYRWPGNVRELENVIERSLVMSRGKRLQVGDFLTGPAGNRKDDDLVTLEDNERRHILRALDATGWRVSGERGAARLLDIHPQTLFSRMKKLGIRRGTTPE